MNDVESSLLGKEARYDHPYDPSLLYPLPRSEKRHKLGLHSTLPFHGLDLWTAFELSWLTPSGKPDVAIAEFRIPADSPNIVESKSFKLYLNSLNHHVFEDAQSLVRHLERDLSKAVGATVTVTVKSLHSDRSALWAPDATHINLDELDVACRVYQPAPSLLECADPGQNVTVQEQVFSDVLRSNCPVTGQPDWASIFIRYRGPQIDHASLLRYIVSFRQCQDFHEHCVERIFCDLMAQCRCESLSVCARYTRRGGLDINPYRATPDVGDLEWVGRTERQ